MRPRQRTTSHKSKKPGTAPRHHAAPAPGRSTAAGSPASHGAPTPTGSPTRARGPRLAGKLSTRRWTLLAAGAGLVVLTLAVTLWGITWGLPDARHIRSFHPDEWTVIEAAQRVHPFAAVSDIHFLNPGFYNYGSLYLYALWLAFNIAQMFGAVVVGLQSDPGNLAALNLTARGVTVAFAVATVLLTWRLGARLFGERVGLGAGLLLAACPLFAVHAHYATVDIPATCWIVAAALAAATAAKVGQRRLRPKQEHDVPAAATKAGAEPRPPIPAILVVSAAASGLAMGTKYNCAVAIVCSWVAWLWILRDDTASRRHATRPSTRPAPARVFNAFYGWAALSFTAAGCFLLSTPGYLTDHKLFMSEFLFEVQHSKTGHEYVFTDTASAFIYHVTHSLWVGMGPPLCVISLVGLALGLWRRNRADLLMAAVVLPYYLVIGMAQIKFMRYVIPLLPFLCIWAARLAFEAVARSGSAAKFVRRAVAVVLCLCGLFALVETAAYDRLLAGPDVRDQAAAWIEMNVPQGSSIGMPRTPWFDTPPIAPPGFSIGLPTALFQKRERDMAAEGYHWPYRIDISDYDAARVKQDRPDYYLMTEWEMRYRLRIHQLDPDGLSDDAEVGRQAWNLMETVNQEYDLVKTFQEEPSLGPIHFRWDFVQDDWLYPNPTIRVYKLKGRRL